MSLEVVLIKSAEYLLKVDHQNYQNLIISEITIHFQKTRKQTETIQTARGKIFFVKLRPDPLTIIFYPDFSILKVCFTVKIKI